jgi:tRNA pseudouridine38-40 synthase
MARYFIKLSFDGTRFHGWQHQANALTVQKVLEDAMGMILRGPLKLAGCGRTDAGVHAREFFAHFDLSMDMVRLERDQLVYRLNSFLSNDIAIQEIISVAPNAHARFSAISRTYQYVISTVKNPFQVGYSWYHYGSLDTGMMNKAAEILSEYSDFTSFSKVDTDTETNICRIHKAFWKESEDHLIFTITADRFLRNMVRAIVGTLIEIGTGKMNLEEFRNIIESKDRRLAGESAPACGLFLTGIEYPSEIFSSVILSDRFPDY